MLKIWVLRTGKPDMQSVPFLTESCPSGAYSASSYPVTWPRPVAGRPIACHGPQTPSFRCVWWHPLCSRHLNGHCWEVRTSTRYVSSLPELPVYTPPIDSFLPSLKSPVCVLREVQASNDFERSLRFRHFGGQLPGLGAGG